MSSPRLVMLVCLSLYSESLPAQARQVTLKFDAFPAPVTYTFDTRRISESEMTRLYRFSPHAFYLYSFWLEMCIDGDPEYLKCGSRDLDDPNFLANAQVNLRKSRRILQELDRVSHPKELAGAVKYLRETLAFSLWIEERRLDFIKTGDLSILEQNYGQLSGKQVCPQVLAEIRATASDRAKWNLIQYKWHNCMNLAFLDQQGFGGNYLRDEWKRFLDAYGIEEVVWFQEE